LNSKFRVPEENCTASKLLALLRLLRWLAVAVSAAETRIGGASAGSLAAACYHSGLPEKTVTDACLVLCDDCRRNGTRGRLRHVLKLFLERCRLQMLQCPQASVFLVPSCV